MRNPPKNAGSLCALLVVFMCHGLWLHYACTHLIPCVLPCLQDYSLGDDTMLDEINLAEPGQYDLPDLSGEEQAVILGVW